MDAELVNKLLEINRTFYSQFGGDFSDTRSSEHLNIEPFREYLRNDIRLLDVGCGNGRLAGALELAGYSLDYVGVDGSVELLARAESSFSQLNHIRTEFRYIEITAPQWNTSLREFAPFDVIVALAVLHHIPSFDLRVRVLHEIHSLLKHDGIFVMSNWQFTRSERLKEKIVPWERVEIGVAGERNHWRLDNGDYLMDWKRGGTGYRYVHLIEPKEVEQLAKASGFQVVKQFYADNDLNLFSILKLKKQ